MGKVGKVSFGGIQFPPEISHALGVDKFGYFKAFFGWAGKLVGGGSRPFQPLIKSAIGVPSKNDRAL